MPGIKPTIQASARSLDEFSQEDFELAYTMLVDELKVEMEQGMGKYTCALTCAIRCLEHGCYGHFGTVYELRVSANVKAAKDAVR